MHACQIQQKSEIRKQQQQNKNKKMLIMVMFMFFSTPSDDDADDVMIPRYLMLLNIERDFFRFQKKEKRKTDSSHSSLFPSLFLIYT